MKFFYVHGECPHFWVDKGLFGLKVVGVWCSPMTWLMLKLKFKDSAPLLVPYLYVTWVFQAVFCVCTSLTNLNDCFAKGKTFWCLHEQKDSFSMQFCLVRTNKNVQMKADNQTFLLHFFSHNYRMHGPKVMMFWMRHLASNDSVLKRGFQNAHWSL